LTQEVICKQVIEDKVYWLVRKDEVEIECLHCCFRDDYNLCSTATECSNHEGSYFVEGEEVKQSLSNWEHDGKVYKLVSGSPDYYNDYNACDKCVFSRNDEACEAAGKFCTTIEGGYLIPLREDAKRKGEEVQESKFGQRVYGTIGGGYSLTNIGGATGGGAYLETNRVLLEAPEKKVEEINGVKYDSDKLQYTLIPPLALKELARNLTLGLKKYPERNNWKKVPNAKERYLDALYRHLEAHRVGEVFDPESSVQDMYHLAAVIANAMFLLELQLEGNLNLEGTK